MNLHSYRSEQDVNDIGEHTLLVLAQPLINVITQLRHSEAQNMPAGLREQLIDMVRHFEMDCQGAQLTNDMIIAARYCLCTSIDEAAVLTRWGSRDVWSRSGLLVTFYNETWGGEKFFQLLAHLSRNPQKNIQLLELINVCLQLGFEGRYRIIENGRTQIETVKFRLLQMIRSVRGSYEQSLSPHSFDIPFKEDAWKPLMPVWGFATLLTLFGVAIYLFLNWHLSYLTSPLISAIYQTELPRVDNESSNITPSPMRDLRHFLASELAEGLVEIRNEPSRTVVMLRGDGLFNSGSARVKERYWPVIRRIAEAIDKVSGQIRITGYTDNTPINQSLFNSNYSLSLARAKSVQKILAETLQQPQRIIVEGRGENDPLIPNDSASHRARNRRVEITLLSAPDKTKSELNTH